MCTGRVSARTGGTVPDEELNAEVERLRAENEALKTQNKKGVQLKVGEKGGLVSLWPGPISNHTLSRAMAQIIGPE
jgi:hypothetical protein